MTNEHFLVTGALGFIGARVTRNLVRQEVQVTAFDLSMERRRLRYLMNDEQLASVQFVQGDITDTEQVRRIIADNDVTHLAHLAALQVPFCKANPPLGVRVSVVGTANVLRQRKLAG